MIPASASHRPSLTSFLFLPLHPPSPSSLLPSLSLSIGPAGYLIMEAVRRNQKREKETNKYRKLADTGTTAAEEQQMSADRDRRSDTSYHTVYHFSSPSLFVSLWSLSVPEVTGAEGGDVGEENENAGEVKFNKLIAGNLGDRREKGRHVHVGNSGVSDPRWRVKRLGLIFPLFLSISSHSLSV